MTSERSVRRWAQWIVLRNETGSFRLSAYDWMAAMRACGSYSKGTKDAGRMMVTYSHGEAHEMALALESVEESPCSGTMVLDVANDENVRGSEWDEVRDGLAPEARKERLIAFLRQGAFSWTPFSELLVHEPPQP
jgi:hypothetical protein